MPAVTYQVQIPKHGAPWDARDFLQLIADDLTRDPYYDASFYEKQSTLGHTLLVKQELTPEHKANIEKRFEITLTKV